jgi:hypothetical protein
MSNEKSRLIKWIVTISTILSGMVGIAASVNMLLSQMKKITNASDQAGPSYTEYRLYNLEVKIDSLESYHND